MTEWLALPPPGGSDAGIDAWLAAFASAGHPARVVRGEEIWVEVPSLRLRGFAATQGEGLEAINFELSDPDAKPTLERVAASFGWDIYPDDGEDDED